METQCAPRQSHRQRSSLPRLRLHALPALRQSHPRSRINRIPSNRMPASVYSEAFSFGRQKASRQKTVQLRIEPHCFFYFVIPLTYDIMLRKTEVWMLRLENKIGFGYRKITADRIYGDFSEAILLRVIRLLWNFYKLPTVSVGLNLIYALTDLIFFSLLKYIQPFLFCQPKIINP